MNKDKKKIYIAAALGLVAALIVVEILDALTRLILGA